MNNIFDLKLNELEYYLESINEKKYIASIIFEWLYKKKCMTFLEMTNLSKELRYTLSNEFKIGYLKVKNKQVGNEAIKYLYELEDGNHIETVLMKHDYGNSICVSSQVGCDMACAFCASGKLKKVRNLTTGEMVAQVITMIKEEEIKIDSVVIMGIGEPMLNYDNVLNFIKIINHPKGIEIGARHITLSTCGIIPGIKRLKEECMQINLAISLHAPTDEVRNKLMPVNKTYNISKLIKEIKEYIVKTNRRVTIEYVMIKNINDSIDMAEKLSKLLKGMNVYVNLIPYNQVVENNFVKSDNDTMMNFYDTLKKNNINVTIRREFGGKIDAACGQLRAMEEKS